jgi:hypothetical protein
VIWKNITVLFGCSVLMGGVGLAFWYQDREYSQPVAEHDGFVRPPLGARIFLHFLNPDCPCSRFNTEHIRDLRRTLTAGHGQVVRFVAVLQGDRPPGKLLEAFGQLHLPVETVVDASGELGRAVGVHSTPQAVIVDSGGRLYFRGNYNASRYCTLPNSQFARIAIQALLSGLPLPNLPLTATTPYGCPLPRKKKIKNEVFPSI